MKTWYWLAAAAIPLLHGQAAAQTVRREPEEMKSVAERERPEFHPVGGRLGSFFLYPTVTISGGATDNARATDSDKRDDAFLFAQGEAKLVSNWSLHSLRASTYASQSVHTLKTENAAQYGGLVDGRYDITNDANIGLTLRADHLIEERGTFVTPPNALEPVRYNRAIATLSTAQNFGHFNAQTTMTFRRLRYDNAISTTGTLLPQEFRDVNVYGTSGSIAYAVSPGYALVLSGVADKRDYTLTASDPRQPGGFDRDSTGGRLEGGVRLTMTDLLTGEIRVGYLVRNYADPRFRDASGASFGADVLWNVTQITSVQLSADRRIDEAGSIDVAGNRVTEVALTVDHELLRNLVVSAYGRYAQIKPLGPFDASIERGGRLSARYFASRLVSLRAAYAHGERSSPDPIRRLHENRVTAGVQFTF